MLCAYCVAQIVLPSSFDARQLGLPAAGSSSSHNPAYFDEHFATPSATHRAFKPDGVIMFSDILTPLTGMGIPFDILEKLGPVVSSPIRSMEALKQARGTFFLVGSGGVDGGGRRESSGV
jgi:hypothetical protein